MQKKITQIVTLILCGGFIGTMMIGVALKDHINDKAHLAELSFYKGQLSEYHTDYKQSTSGLRLKYKFVAMTIAGLDQTLGIYRPEQQYDDILNNIKIGDTVSVYYRAHLNHNDIFVSGIRFNPDIYQLDINNRNYIQIDRVKSAHSKGDIGAFIGGILVYIVVITGTIVTVRKK